MPPGISRIRSSMGRASYQRSDGQARCGDGWPRTLTPPVARSYRRATELNRFARDQRGTGAAHGPTHRPAAHRRRRPRGGRLQDLGLVRVQQPGPPRPRDRPSGSARSPSELGYTPHPVARMLSQRETLTIGVLTPQALSVVFSEPVLRGIQRPGSAAAAEASGYALHFISPLRGIAGPGACTAPRSTASSPSACPAIIRRSSEIRRAGVPIVLVDSTALPELELDRGRRRRRCPRGGRAPARARTPGPARHRRRATGARRGARSARASPPDVWRGYRDALGRSRHRPPG